MEHTINRFSTSISCNPDFFNSYEFVGKIAVMVGRANWMGWDLPLLQTKVDEICKNETKTLIYIESLLGKIIVHHQRSGSEAIIIITDNVIWKSPNAEEQNKIKTRKNLVDSK